MRKNEVYIGIDVSKGYSDFYIVDGEKVLLERPFQLDDEKEGHKIAKDIVLKLLKRYSKVVIGVENTGGYERNWVKSLKSLRDKNDNVFMLKLNPKAVKYQIAILMETVVDDAISAKGIAMYMIDQYPIKIKDWMKSASKTEVETEQQLLYSMIQALIKQKTAKLNQLEKLIYSSFPEILQYAQNSFPIWTLRLLEKYPSAKAVRNAKISGMVKIRNITERKAKEIKELARHSVGSLGSEISQMIVNQYCKDIINLDSDINKYKAILINEYKDDYRVDIITSLKGVADWSAVSFLVELGDLSRFESAPQIASFYGVHPSFKQSGDGKYKVKMSKQGSAEMRGTLYMIAHNLTMHSTYFKELYAKHIAKGKKHSVVMGILMHKALRVIYGMLKNNQYFNEDVDRMNREKKTEEVNIPQGHSKTLRRYQELDLNAPISRSNSKKRKAILSPQSSTVDESHEVNKNSLVQT